MNPIGLNIRDFGATGDGITDDAPAINAAFALMSTSSFYGPYLFPGRLLYFPKGKYRVASTIRVSRNCTLQGDGMNSTWILPDAGITAFQVEGDVTTPPGGGEADHSVIKGMHIYTPSHAATAWQATHAYVAGNLIYAVTNLNYACTFKCTTGGTSGGTEPVGFAAAIEGGTVADGGGSLVWTAVVVAGIRLKARARIENIYCDGIDGNGIYIRGATGDSPPTNANGFQLDRIVCSG